MNHVFTGKAGIVTGASSGIGRCIAQTLGSAGMELWLVGRSAAELDATAAAIAAASGAPTHCVVLDLAAPGTLATLVTEVGSVHPYLFTLINNAGVMYPEALTATDPAHWREMMAINLLTPMESCSAAVRVMRQHGRPANLINISSLAALEHGYGAYGMSKSALNHLGHTLRHELEQDDIRMTTILPGGFTTNLARGFSADTLTKLGAKLAQSGLTPDSDNFRKVMGDPQHIANMIAYVLQQPIEINFEEIVIRPAIHTQI